MGNIAISNVTKKFDSTEVIHGINLKIYDGEFVVLVGPSGCGKTTLLRMIAGLESITDGNISIDDKIINNIKPKERDCAMVFQNYALYPHMKVAANMGFSLKIKKASKEEINKKVKDVAKILEIEDYLERYPRQLSGGQRQRVAMGRAIVRNPKVFLFDEPLSNLDAKLRVQMRTQIKLLHARLKTTLVYVTHDQVEAMTMADKIVVMNEGLVEQTGAPLELYDKPVNIFVAGFIGSPSMNLLNASINSNSINLGSAGSIPITRKTTSENNLDIILGIRPSHMDISKNGEGLKFQIDVIEPTGADSLVYGKINDTECCVQTSERLNLKSGEIIHILPNEDNLHFFDNQSNERIN
jgi:multiple sugar transport system ATP-binding protein|tara:strand:+ start:1178 stop:2239 length:1062 start_codon:yes stop_codon:yes gene_type:complete